MSFYEYQDTILEGSLVLAFMSRGMVKPINIKSGEFLNTRYGNFAHEKMIGLKYGTQMGGTNNKGFVHLLHPLAELWTISLPHRTQIVYTPDLSYIIQRLGITSGSRVLEAGTGSASFTHSFARTLGSTGQLFTYEFHEPRFLEAQAELQSHGLLDVNTIITHRDVCADGFHLDDLPLEKLIDNSLSADSVFLDLPSPWTAIPHLKLVVSGNSKVGICCFSPCIEQVDKTIEALEANGWTDIEMVEIANRRWEARKEMVRDVGDVIARLRQIQERKDSGIESRRQGVLGEDRSRTGSEEPETAGAQKRRPENDDVLLGEAKLARLNPFGKGQRVREGDAGFQWKEVTKVEPEIKTHTSYLTFAYLVPSKK